MSEQIPATSHERWISAESLRAEGRQEGRQQGLLEAREELARRLLARGTPVAEVCVLTDLDEPRVRELLP